MRGIEQDPARPVRWSGLGILPSAPAGYQFGPSAGRCQAQHRDRPDVVGPLGVDGVAAIQLDGECEQPVAVGALRLARHETPAARPDVRLAFRFGFEVPGELRLIAGGEDQRGP
jgi:hypothetical protein